VKKIKKCNTKSHRNSVFTRDSICYSAYTTAIPSVYLSVGHTSRLYQNGWTYHRNSFTLW